MEKFIIDKRLSDSSFLLAEWELSNIYLKNEENYLWFILVPRINNVHEIFELTDRNQKKLIDEVSRLSKKVHAQFNPDKINIATLGNIVSQLHIHVVARFKTDQLWPQGIWQSALDSNPYEAAARDQLLALLIPILRQPYPIVC